MKPIILAPLVALVLTGGSAGAYLWVTSEGSVEEATVAQPTSTPTPAPAADTPTAAPTAEPTPTPAPTETPAPAETPASADWTTYQDAELGFSFPHPADLTAFVRLFDLSEREGHSAVHVRTLTFSNSAGVPAISLFIAANPDSLTIEKWLEVYPGCCFGKPEPITIGGQSGLLFPQGALDENPTILFRDGGYLFGLAAYVRSIPDSPKPPILSEDNFRQLIGGFSLGS